MSTNIDSASHGMLTNPYQASAPLDKEERRRRVGTAATLSILVVAAVVVSLIIAF